MKYLIFFIFIILSLSLNAQSTIPAGFIKSFNQLKLDQKYQIKEYIKPSSLHADFNGDGNTDVAVPVIEKRTHKKGILLINGRTNQYFVFGAGTKFGNGSDNFSWAAGWTLYKSKFAYESRFNRDGDILGSKKVKLNRPAFFIHDLEDGEPNSGGIIYWNGKKYVWIQWGE
ncbi:MAG: hypothetical protein JWP94_2795 [Mucilaginibacter sp.]|nr:hypothetical protein [Mucilaginibacter sp.]